MCNYIYMIKSKVRRQRLDDIDQMYQNLQDLGLFQKFPDLGTLESNYIKTLEKEEEIINKLFRPLQDETCSRRNHLWIGINPPISQYTMRTLCNATKALVKKYKWLEDSLWCVEQNTDKHIRPHIHLMAEYKNNMKPGRIIAMLANHYKVEKNSIDCKSFLNGYLYGEHIDYIKNFKKEDKKINVLKDINDRKEFLIENYYSTGIYKDVQYGTENDDQSGCRQESEVQSSSSSDGKEKNRSGQASGSSSG